MIWATRFKPSLLSRTIAFGLMFLCSRAAFGDEALWKMYVETGTKAYENERYATAETMFLAAHKEAEGFGRNDLRLASTLFQLARVYNAEKKDEKAQLDCRRAIEIWDAPSTPPSIEFVDDLKEVLTKLAGELRKRQKYDEAEPLYKRAQDIAEKHFGPDNPHLADALSARADNFSDGKKYDEAEPLYMRALAITKKKQGSEHADVVNAIQPLAVTLFAQRKFDQARPLVEQAIAILEKSGQPEGLAAPLAFLNKLANKLRDQEKYDEAEPLYKRAQDIAEKHFGPDDPHLAEALSARADNFSAAKKYDEAEPLYKRALDITEKNKGSEDGDVVNAIRDLAVTLFEEKKFDRARLLTEQAIAILEKNNEPKGLAAALTFLGRTCEGLHSYADAERAYKRALDALGRDNGAALNTLENYSRMLHDLKREKEARALEAHIHKIRAATKAVEERR
jgi:tetratricopeptide (TPR) repeat protein